MFALQIIAQHSVTKDVPVFFDLKTKHTFNTIQETTYSYHMTFEKCGLTLLIDTVQMKSTLLHLKEEEGKNASAFVYCRP